MKILVKFVILLMVSQHALGVEVKKVEVEEGQGSVLLPCEFPTFYFDNCSVEWSRSDLNPSTVHLRQDKGDHLQNQNQNYRGRTSMRTDALEYGELRLNLTHPSVYDTGNYTCSILRHGDKVRQFKVQLKVRKAPVPTWVPVLMVLLVLLILGGVVGGVLWSRRSKSNTGKMNEGKDISRMFWFCGSIVLMQRLQTTTSHVETEKTQSELLMCVQLRFWFPVLSVPQVVEVDSGVESVLLPWRTNVPLTDDVRVEWTDKENRKVHVYQNGSDHPEEQDRRYRGGTEMKKDLKTGDVSLTMKHVTPEDTNIYTCTVYSRDGNRRSSKVVFLKVRVPQVEVEVDSGVESVLLPWRTNVPLTDDVTVEWTDEENRKVHVYQNGSDDPEEQHRRYRGGTEMKKDLKTGDVSLTLKYPTWDDSGRFLCTIYSNHGNILVRKDVELKVRVCQVEVEEGAESVLLPFRTTPDLPGDTKVVWCRFKPGPVMVVHLYQNGSDQSDEQDQFYRDRTEMNEDLLRTGDLSLRLKNPTETDSGDYGCVVESRDIWRWTTVMLQVKGTVQVQGPTEDIRTSSSSPDPTPLLADSAL
ncbi:butyrophilin-like protein 2 [Pholidichthys leucotaenia]